VNLTILSGGGNPALTEAIARTLGVHPAACELGRFPDGELRVAVGESVRGRDVYVVQPTAPPVESRILELLLLADACRRAGAARLTAVVPYFGYARQDRRAQGREPVAARLVSDLLPVAGVQRVIAVDLHSNALEGVTGIPLEHLSAVRLLAGAAGPVAAANAVVVAPDLGAAKLADRYARALHVPVALVHKARLSGAEVMVRGLTGDVRGRRPVIVDDMITTGATVAAAIGSLVAAGSAPGVTVIATHAVLVDDAVERLRHAGVERLVVTDSVAQSGLPGWVQTVTLAPLLAEAIGRLHGNESLAPLISHG
jgi:ribose-phosphate pyrophosphokinase